MKPYIHAKLSARRYGGDPEEYMFIHDFLDSSKAYVPDMRHRAVYHHALGIYMCEDKFGQTFKNSEDRVISVRDIGEEHVLEDMGTIPTIQDYLSGMPMYAWLGGTKVTKQIWTTEEVD
jgi:hypothetical protein